MTCSAFLAMLFGGITSGAEKELTKEQRDYFAGAERADIKTTFAPAGTFGKGPFHREVFNVLWGLGVKLQPGGEVVYDVACNQKGKVVSGTFTVRSAAKKVRPYTVQFKCPVTGTKDEAEAERTRTMANAGPKLVETKTINVDMTAFRTALDRVMDQIYGAGAAARGRAATDEKMTAAVKERAKENTTKLALLKTFKVGETTLTEAWKMEWGEVTDGRLGIIRTKRLAGARNMEYTMGWFEAVAAPGDDFGAALAATMRMAREDAGETGEVKFSVPGAAETVVCILKFGNGVLTAMDWRGTWARGAQ